MFIKYLIIYIFVNITIAVAPAAATSQTGQMCTKIIEKTRNENGRIIKFTETISKCCDDLLKINDECKPYCENCEYLTSNVRQCQPMYQWNETSLNCEPSCDCTNGYCLKPYQCTCHKGYAKANGDFQVCEPVCDQPQCPKFSFCTKPQKCECFIGYEYDEDTNECEPMCNGQTNIFDSIINRCVLKNCSCTSAGYCLDFYDQCICYKGYHKINRNSCEPTCTPECENAKCIADNQCECWPGYHDTEDPRVCESNDMCRRQPCLYGECLKTGECKCKKGFRKSFTLSGQAPCETYTVFIGKIMSIILGIPLGLASLVFLVVYIAARNKTKKTVGKQNNTIAIYNYGEQQDNEDGCVAFVNNND